MTDLAVVTALNAVVTLLGSQAAGRFQVIGYQLMKKPAEINIDNVLVQCWIDTADIDWSRSSRNGPKAHEASLRIQFTVSQPAKADYDTLEDPNATDSQRAVALSNLTSPAVESTNALYAAWGAVFEILYDARNLTFGLPAGSISDRDYSRFRQDEFPPRGGLGIVTATSILTFRVNEAYLGDVGYTPDTIISDIDLQGVSIPVDNVSNVLGSDGFLILGSDGFIIQAIEDNEDLIDTISKAGVLVENN